MPKSPNLACPAVVQPGLLLGNESMKRLTVALLGAISLSACAQPQSPAADAKTAAKPAIAAPAGATPKTAPGTPEARAVAAIRELNQQVHIDRVAAAPMPGFREVIVGGKALYVSDDGKYLIQGSL